MEGENKGLLQPEPRAASIATCCKETAQRLHERDVSWHYRTRLCGRLKVCLECCVTQWVEKRLQIDVDDTMVWQVVCGSKAFLMFISVRESKIYAVRRGGCMYGWLKPVLLQQQGWEWNEEKSQNTYGTDLKEEKDNDTVVTWTNLPLQEKDLWVLWFQALTTEDAWQTNQLGDIRLKNWEPFWLPFGKHLKWMCGFSVVQHPRGNMSRSKVKKGNKLGWHKTQLVSVLFSRDTRPGQCLVAVVSSEFTVTTRETWPAGTCLLCLCHLSVFVTRCWLNRQVTAVQERREKTALAESVKRCLLWHQIRDSEGMQTSFASRLEKLRWILGQHFCFWKAQVVSFLAVQFYIWT